MKTMFYRKYRPQTWEELDNKRIRETLGKAVMDNNWSHAYLLLGSRGTGKTTTARLIAKTVNCEKRKKGEEPCNRCDSCLAITAGSSLDVFEIDAASNTGVDDIRDLREKVRLAPARGPFKIYIIDEVHMLSTSAFNALLKTLEEPPAHVIFVLATTDPQKLPDTIISRCLVYDFGRAQEEEILEKLKKISGEEKIKIDDKDLLSIAKAANGSHRDAQKFLEQLTTSGAKVDLERPNATNLIKFLENRERKKALKEIEKFVEANGKIKELISEMISLLRDQLLEGKDVNDLIKKLIEANTLLRDSPIPSLPLEMVVVEWCGEEKEPEQIASSPSSPRNDDTFELIKSKWDEIVAATKPHNHSLNAFLKAAKPTEIKNGSLIIQVMYKFHAEKLQEPKNRDILEQVINDIIGNKVKVKFELKSRG